MVAAVSDFDVVRGFVDRLEALGYRTDQMPAVPPDAESFERRNARSEATEHLHIVLADGAKWRALVRFRDWLRTHPEDRDAYQALKQRLAAEYDDTRGYSEAKTEFVDAIVRRAEAASGER